MSDDLDLPRGELFTNTDMWSAAICDRLDVLISRLPPVPPASAAGRVELTEPAVRPPAVEPALFEEPVPPRPRARTRAGKPTLPGGAL